MGKKYSDEELLEVLLNIEEYCKNNSNIIPPNKFIEQNIITINVINRYCQLIGFNTIVDYLRSKGFMKKEDFKLKNKIISNKNISIEDLYELVEIFIDKYDRIPLVKDFRQCNNLPSWDSASKTLKKNNISINQFYLDFGRKDNPRSQIEFYDDYVEIFKQVYTKNGHINSIDLNKNKYGLPSANWLINNCSNKNVKTYNDFIIWCGLIPSQNIPKQMAIKIIYNMQSKLDRPITAADFDNPKDGEIGIRTIYRIWGETHIMQRELGLEVTGKHKSIKTLDELKEDLIKVCNEIYKKYNRKTITYKDIKSFDFTLNVGTYRRNFENNNENMRDFIKSIGFELQNEGVGLNYIFEDGEKVRSQYELNFSNFLRHKLKLEYQKDYFRDVLYKDFVEKCNKNFDCDYIIHYNNRIIYIEIAGMIDLNIDNFKNNKISNSKAKEKYRKILIKKEKMLKENNLEYYIIFPQDCNEEFFNAIFNKEGEINGKVNCI